MLMLAARNQLIVRCDCVREYPAYFCVQDIRTAPFAPFIEETQAKVQTMRTFLLSAIAASTVLASTAIGLSSDANAASRHAQRRVQPAPIVRQDPYGSFNTFAPGVSAFDTRRNVNPISGTPRWNAAGGAP
jgi:hypothetical protein